jgi:NAD-specific glutamate dehydrogenase
MEQPWVVDSMVAAMASIEVDGAMMITVPVLVLPMGVRQGHVLRVKHEGSQAAGRSVVSIEIDEGATSKALAASAAPVNKGTRQANDPGRGTWVF